MSLGLPVAAARNFWLLLAFDVVMYSPLYWPYMFHLVCTLRGLSALEFGALKSIYYGSVILLELPGGIFADRFGRRGALIGCAAFNALGCFGYALGSDFWSFAAAEVALGVSTALLSGADSALLYDSLLAEGQEARYAQAEGRIRTACYLAFALTMVVSDLWLIPSGGPALTYGVTGALSLIGVAAAAALRDPPRATADSVRSVALGAMRDALARPRVLPILAYGSGLYVLMRAANSLLFDPVLSAQQVPPDRFGSVTIGIALTGAVAAHYTARWLARGERALFGALPVLALVTYAGLAWARGPWMLAAMCLQGPLMSVLSIVTPVALNREIASSGHRATLLSLQSVAWRGSYALIAPIIGWTLDAFSVQTAVLAMALLGALPLCAAFWLVARANRAAAQ